MENKYYYCQSQFTQFNPILRGGGEIYHPLETFS